MTRNGKIARLPKNIRDQLNQRLDDGQSAEDILPWLNRLPVCKKMLAEKFDSRPITRQNLSQWKQGGYQVWLRTEQTREQVQSLVEQAEDLEKDLVDSSIADRIATVLSVQLLAAIQQLDTIKDPKVRWQNLEKILRELSRLRREDHHARRVRLTEEQWEDKRRRQEEQDEKDRKKAERGRLIAWAFSWFTRKDQIESHGGGEVGRRWADWFHRVRNDLPLPKWFPGPWADTHFGPDGTNWSNVSLPDEPNGSSPNESKGSSSSSSIQYKPQTASPQKERRSPTRRDSNKTKPAKYAPPQNSDLPAAIPPPRTHHSPALPKLPSDGNSSASPVKVNQSKSSPPPTNITTASSPAQPSERRSPDPRDSNDAKPETAAPPSTLDPPSSTPNGS